MKTFFFFQKKRTFASEPSELAILSKYAQTSFLTILEVNHLRHPNKSII